MRSTLIEVCERFDELLATRAANIAELQVSWVDDSEHDEPHVVMFIATLSDGEMLPVSMALRDPTLFDQHRFCEAVLRMMDSRLEMH